MVVLRRKGNPSYVSEKSRNVTLLRESGTWNLPIN